jgi:transcriptional regulator with XRE-family HTH domain
MQRGDNKMDAAKIIKELREQTGMNRREFSEYTMIPVRTLEDWEAGKRTPPEYVPRLLTYQLLYDKWIKNQELQKDEKDVLKK